LRTREGDRLVVPNEKLASETIRNSTIRSDETLAEATIDVPAADVRRIVSTLAAEGDQVLVTALTAETATILVRKWADGAPSAERAASDLRLELAERLAKERA